jgi:hypothetical protein
VALSAARPATVGAPGSPTPAAAPTGAPDRDAGSGGDQGGAAGTASAGIARAESNPGHEGQWILPVVRMMARLRARFSAVADAQAEADVLEDALRTSEVRLTAALGSLEATPSAPAGHGAADDAGADAGSDGGTRAAADAGDDADSDDGVPSAGCIEEGRRAARARAAADLRVALDGLERGRPATCGSREGSAVCRPAPVDVWTGSEFTLVDPSAPGATDRLLENLDQFLQP